MVKVNKDYQKLQGSYLFSTIAKKVGEYTAANPDKKIIRLGIGDVTRPLSPKIISTLHASVDEMADEKTRRREFAALIAARRETGIDDCTIVTWDEEGEEDGVRIVPAWKWLLS